MASLTIALVIFACVFGGALGGIELRKFLPKHHLDSDTRDVIKLAVGLIGTMSALVLGLMVASTKGSYDTHRAEITQVAANTILLDRVLAHYGPEAAEARTALKEMLTRIIEGRRNATAQVASDPGIGREVLFDRIQDLQPHTDAQHRLQSQAEALAINLGQTRWLLFAQSGTSISTPFLVIVVFWLSALSLSFGLFAPRNATALAALLVTAASVAAAIFLIVELDHPFSGLMRISDAPLRGVLGLLDR